MSGFFSANVTSPFPDPNSLYDASKVALAGQTYQANQLLNQGRQMDLTAADHEQVARLSAALLNEPDLTKRGDLYARGVGMLQSQNLAKYAPPTLPDESTLRMLAAQGVSSEKLFEYGAGRTAAQGALGALGISGNTGTGTGTGTTAGPAGGGGDFAAKLTTAESGGNPSVINKQGYTGQFQFGKQRLSELGYYTPAPGEDMKDNTKWAGKVSVPGFNVTDQASFAANPAAQQAVFNTHLGDIDKAIDQMPNAGKFDRNGLRAVAHLGGISGMERFTSSGGVYDPADANGTRLSSYYQRFSGGGTQTATAPSGGGGTPGRVQVASVTPTTATDGTTAPPGSTAAPDAPWDLPGAPAPDQPPAPATTATAPPAATTAPAATAPAPAPQVPLEPLLDLKPSGLTKQQEDAAWNDLHQPGLTRANVQQIEQHYQQLAANNVTSNRTAQSANLDRQREAAAAALAQTKEAREAANQAAVRKEAEAAAADRAQRLALEQKKAEQGSTQNSQDDYTLRNEGPSSPQYADAYVRQKWTVAPNGNIIENDMSRYPAPNRSIQRPTFLPAPTPQALDEVRKADTDAKVITSGIDHYVDVFKATGGGSWDAYFANPKDPKAQQLLGAFDRLKTVLRSPVYYNTGVLQPAEMAMLKEDLVSPQTLRGLFATPQALASRLGEIKLAVLTRQDAELRSIGKDGVIVRDKADFAKVPDGGQYYDKIGELHVK